MVVPGAFLLADSVGFKPPMFVSEGVMEEDFFMHTVVEEIGRLVSERPVTFCKTGGWGPPPPGCPGATAPGLALLVPKVPRPSRPVRSSPKRSVKFSMAVGPGGGGGPEGPLNS